MHQIRTVPFLFQMVGDTDDVPPVLFIQCPEHSLRLFVLYQPFHWHQQQCHHLYLGSF